MRSTARWGAHPSRSETPRAPPSLWARRPGRWGASRALASDCAGAAKCQRAVQARMGLGPGAVLAVGDLNANLGGAGQMHAIGHSAAALL
eukprot:CAMPEP_0206011400 /NCGR_PEP_ID=MMETSP1464-20131121/13171_1 /ASSEMBLY_ACC=CAM_ASM_001124 /TAXON_ID=119497 /ORGANISM="Exanthemachrysis gayraliae, Strain RCC1523" /LENGTH=89 /DNA_ID=CAMNT_0053385063 /DNA_START=281 /DNA_END=547 /DNA_ORIENTATION=-